MPSPCSCLASVTSPSADVASPFAHALLVWRPFLLMPCLASPFPSCLAGVASPFAHALLFAETACLDAGTSYRFNIGEHQGTLNHTSAYIEGGNCDAPHSDVLLKASTSCSSDLRLSKEPTAQATLSCNQDISLGSKKA